VKAQIFHGTLPSILISLSFLLQTVNAAEHADFIFVNGNIHTVNERQRHAEAIAGAYPWQSFLKSGAIISGGPDAPVERGEPMIEFYAAISRKSRLRRFEENDKGSIEVGKLADFTILFQDIMKIREPEILNTHSVVTVIGGEVVFEARQLNRSDGTQAHLQHSTSEPSDARDLRAAFMPVGLRIG